MGPRATDCTRNDTQQNTRRLNSRDRLPPFKLLPGEMMVRTRDASMECSGVALYDMTSYEV